MLTVTDVSGRSHQIAYVHKSDIPALREMKRRFDGVVALYSANTRSWVAIESLDLDSAVENDVCLPARRTA